MKWLIGIVTAVFSLVGFIIAGMGFGISAIPGSHLARRALEFKLLGAFFIVSPWVSILLLKLKFRRESRFRNSILEEGTRKRAVLISCQETGTYINEAPQVSMIVQVEDEDGRHRNRAFKGVVPVLKATGIRPGMVLEITENTEGMVIHWP